MLPSELARDGARVTSLTFTVLGPPMPKERARRGKNGRWYTPERTRRYEAAVRNVASLTLRQRFGGYVGEGGWPWLSRFDVRIVAFFPDARRRDVDNAAKSCCDAINKSGIWQDDSQISRLIVEHEIDRANPRTEITITPIATVVPEVPKSRPRIAKASAAVRPGAPSPPPSALRGLFGALTRGRQ